MSTELYVFLEDSRVPSRDDWQLAIDQLAFPLQLEADWDLHSDSGFLPAILAGAESGFEFYLEELPEGDPGIGLEAAPCDRVAAFRLGGDMQELVSAMYAAAALTDVAKGRFYDEEKHSLVDGPAAVEYALRIAREAA